MGQVGKIIKKQEKIGNYYGKTVVENMTDDELALFLAHQSLKSQRKIEQQLKIIKIVMISYIALRIIIFFVVH